MKEESKLPKKETDDQSKKKSVSKFIEPVSKITTSEDYKGTKGVLYELLDMGKIIVGLVLPIIGGIAAIMYIFGAEHDKAQFGLVILNLLVLFSWFIVTRNRELKCHDLKFIDETKVEEYGKYFRLNDSRKIKKRNQKVNKVVSQLMLCIAGYASCLIIVYIAFLVGNKFIYSNLYAIPIKEVDVSALEPYLKIFQDVFNLISAAFLYLGFKVLYNQTLDDENRMNYYGIDAFLVCFIVIALYMSFTHSTMFSPKESNITHKKIIEIGNISNTYKDRQNLTAADSLKLIQEKLNNSNLNASDRLMEIKRDADEYNEKANIAAKKEMREAIKEYERDNTDKWSNIFKLIIGSLNGLAMSLLFGRYISIEHSIEDKKNKKSYGWFSIGTVFLLPIYALAQPLFGTFDINAFGDAAFFANCIFFICWLGKIFFLYFTYRYIKERKLHEYLHDAYASSTGTKLKIFNYLENDFSKLESKVNLTKEEISATEAAAELPAGTGEDDKAKNQE